MKHSAKPRPTCRFPGWFHCGTAQQWLGIPSRRCCRPGYPQSRMSSEPWAAFDPILVRDLATLVELQHAPFPCQACKQTALSDQVKAMTLRKTYRGLASSASQQDCADGSRNSSCFNNLKFRFASNLSSQQQSRKTPTQLF